MSKYDALWKAVKRDGRNRFSLNFAEIEDILGFPIDHSFLNCKTELQDFGYRVGKISLKEKSIIFLREPKI